jgi:hypothetical protein
MFLAFMRTKISVFAQYFRGCLNLGFGKFETYFSPFIAYFLERIARIRSKK